MELTCNRNINNRCMAFGITFNWNSVISIEIDFMVWYIELIFIEPSPEFIEKIQFKEKDYFDAE